MIRLVVRSGRYIRDNVFLSCSSFVSSVLSQFSSTFSLLAFFAVVYSSLLVGRTGVTNLQHKSSGLVVTT